MSSVDNLQRGRSEGLQVARRSPQAESEPVTFTQPLQEPRAETATRQFSNRFLTLPCREIEPESSGLTLRATQELRSTPTTTVLHLPVLLAKKTQTLLPVVFHFQRKHKLISVLLALSLLMLSTGGTLLALSALNHTSPSNLNQSVLQAQKKNTVAQNQDYGINLNNISTHSKPTPVPTQVPNNKSSTNTGSTASGGAAASTGTKSTTNAGTASNNGTQASAGTKDNTGTKSNTGSSSNTGTATNTGSSSSTTKKASAGSAAKTSSSSLSWPVGQCTYWANERYHELTGYWVPWSGNAGDWVEGARAASWNVSTKPHIPSIIVLLPGVEGADSSYGHVAVAEKRIDSDTVQASTMNWYANGGGFDIQSSWNYTVASGVYFVWHP